MTGPIALSEVLFHDHGGLSTDSSTKSSVIMKCLALASCPAITSVTAGSFTPYSRCLHKDHVIVDFYPLFKPGCPVRRAMRMFELRKVNAQTPLGGVR